MAEVDIDINDNIDTGASNKHPNNVRYATDGNYVKTYVNLKSSNDRIVLNDESGRSYDVETNDNDIIFFDGVEHKYDIVDDGKSIVHSFKIMTNCYCYDWRIGRMIDEIYHDRANTQGYVIYASNNGTDNGNTVNSGFGRFCYTTHQIDVTDPNYEGAIYELEKLPLSMCIFNNMSNGRDRWSGAVPESGQLNDNINPYSISENAITIADNDNDIFNALRNSTLNQSSTGNGDICTLRFEERTYSNVGGQFYVNKFKLYFSIYENNSNTPISELDTNDECFKNTFISIVSGTNNELKFGNTNKSLAEISSSSKDTNNGKMVFCLEFSRNNSNDIIYELKCSGDNGAHVNWYSDNISIDANYYGRDHSPENGFLKFDNNKFDDMTFSRVDITTLVKYVVYSTSENFRNNYKIEIIDCDVEYCDNLKLTFTDRYEFKRYVAGGTGVGSTSTQTLNEICKIEKPFLNALHNVQGYEHTSSELFAGGQTNSDKLYVDLTNNVIEIDSIHDSGENAFISKIFWQQNTVDIIPYMEQFSIDNKLLISGLGGMPLLHRGSVISDDDNVHEFYSKFKVKFNGYTDANSSNIIDTNVNIKVKDYLAEKLDKIEDDFAIRLPYKNDDNVTLSYPFYDLRRYVNNDSNTFDRNNLYYIDGSSIDYYDYATHENENFTADLSAYLNEKLEGKNNNSCGYYALSPAKFDASVDDCLYKDLEIYYKFKTNNKYPKILDLEINTFNENNKVGSHVKLSDNMLLMFGTNNYTEQFSFNTNISNTEKNNANFGYNGVSFESNEIFNIEDTDNNDNNDGEFNFITLNDDSEYVAFLFDKALCKVIAVSNDINNILSGECLTDRYLLLASKVIKNKNNNIKYPSIQPKLKKFKNNSED